MTYLNRWFGLWVLAFFGVWAGTTAVVWAAEFAAHWAVLGGILAGWVLDHIQRLLADHAASKPHPHAGGGSR
ncbi:hypothetical protein BRC87_00350 [Halobacteriales archaeon QS_4_66_20]|nr:MAG: hypothetical protein BRC87_00350 [Halobacteriales archaeon QS_4_66_20]